MFVFKLNFFLGAYNQKKKKKKTKTFTFSAQKNIKTTYEIVVPGLMLTDETENNKINIIT
jgi:hypothetical protein